MNTTCPIEGYDWVLFDQGGTLFEPLPGCYSERNQRLAIAELGERSVAQRVGVGEVFMQARKQADAAFLRQTSYSHQQLVTEHLLRGLLALGLCEEAELVGYQNNERLPPRFKAIAPRYFDRQRQAVVSQLRLQPGCHRLLDSLKRTARLAVVSNNADAFLQPLITRYRLDRYFEAVLSSDALGACKPDPEIFKRAFAKLGISNSSRSRVLYVGDSVAFDVVGARAAGIDVALLSSARPEDQQSNSPKPTYRASSLAELELLLTRARA